MHSETMDANEQLLRLQMKEMLSQCSARAQDVFRRMYNHEGKFEHSVDGVPSDKLDWAFSQIETTLKKPQIREGSEK